MAAVTERDIRIAVRAWLIAAGQSGGLENAQVIHAEAEGLRPPPPFAEVRVVVYRNPDGRPERFDRDDGSSGAVRYVRSSSRDTVSINTYGAGAQEWLARACDFLYHPSIAAQLATAGFSIEPIGGMQNLSGLLDDRYETRFQQDFEVSYASLSDGEALTPADHIVVDATAAGPGSTFTVDAP